MTTAINQGPEGGRIASGDRAGRPSDQAAARLGDAATIPCAVAEYVRDYEFRGDGSDYTPNDNERALLEDAINGFLAETSFDPARCFELLADLHHTLVLTAEYNPTAFVASFVDSAIQFKRVSDFLRASRGRP